jgi:acyl-lipid omega-6 desaturase (Delta-12 desaturase)
VATAKQAVRSAPVLAPDRNNWRDVVAPYESPRFWRSWWEVATSFVPFFVLWYMMYLLVDINYPLMLALSVVTAGFMMRVFIIFHDCGHGSFFASQRLNNLIGRIAGIITFTPYDNWRHEHAIHHATSADLDRRGTGDVWTMTLQEYMASPWYKKIGYSVFRTPIVMLGIGPFFMFLVSHRFANPTFGWREKFSVLMTNLALLGTILWLWNTIGIINFLKIELPIMLFAGMAGVWMFFVQHNFDDGHWVRHPEWDYVQSAIKGSSWYKLPKVIQWFTGNIGLHHIHHLSPRIPNYNLEACHNDNEMFQEVQPITFMRSLKSLAYRFWDEEQRKFVWYDALWKRIRPLETAAESASD